MAKIVNNYPNIEQETGRYVVTCKHCGFKSQQTDEQAIADRWLQYHVQECPSGNR